MASAAKAPFDLAKASEALFASRRAQFGWLLILAVVSRISVFGDTNYFNDEYFYFRPACACIMANCPMSMSGIARARGCF